jgi:Short C-terminal domain
MPGLLRGVVRTAAIAGTATAVSNRVSERQGERWAAQGKFGQAEPQPAAQAPPQGAGDDTIVKLKELGELRDQGVLTDEEFAQQKARLLG